MCSRVSRVLIGGCLVLAGCSSGGQDAEVVFESEGAVNIVGPVVSDGDSIWWLTEVADDSRALEVVKADSGTGVIEWSEPVGFGTVFPLFLDDGVLWVQVNSPESPDESDHDLVRVDAESGEVTGEVPTESYGVAVVDDLLWTVDGFSVLDLVDPSTPELVESLSLYDVESLDFEPSFASDAIEFDDAVWVTSQNRAFGLNPDTLELIDSVEFPAGGFGRLEIQDGVLWAQETDRLKESDLPYSALKIDTESATTETFDLYESPVGTVEYNGFTFDVTGENKVEQIDASGETVATYENLDPFSFVVTDGYLWAVNEDQVVRYPTAG